MPFQNSESRLRRFPVFVVYGGAVLVPYIGSQRMPSNFLLPFWIPLHDRMIDFFHLMILKLHVQRAVTLRIPREDHYPAGDFIQPMNNEYFSIFFLKHFDEIRRVFFPPIWEDGNPCGFVEDEDVIVHMYNLHS